MHRKALYRSNKTVVDSRLHLGAQLVMSRPTWSLSLSTIWLESMQSALWY